MNKLLMFPAIVAVMTMPLTAFANTKMVEIADEYDIQQCRLPLLTISEELIGEKDHRLYVDQAKRHADKYPFTVLGVITYNDRDSQVVFNAAPMVSGDCEVSYQEVFALSENCLAVREQVFKKWEYVGRLSDDSFFLRHKERFTRNATLTSIKSGSECLVTRRNSGI